MSSGWVLDFTNATFADFFRDEAGIDIYDDAYAKGSGSKANRLRAFWDREPDQVVGPVLSSLVVVWEQLNAGQEEPPVAARCRAAVERLLHSSGTEGRSELRAGTADGGGATAGRRTNMRCFVIQPFDEGGEFDQRYEQVLEPAIKAAGLEPYRVDRDPTASVIIESIEQEIRDSAIVLADITLDNANIWYELGYARALGREVVMISGPERTKLPFDIQHRAVLKYATTAPKDFDDLRAKVEARLQAALQRSEQKQQIGDLVSLPPTETESALRPYEIAVLAAVAAQTLGPDNVATGNDVGEAMGKAGFNGTATALGLRTMQTQGFLSVDEYVEEGYNNSYTYTGYVLTDKGVMWLREHENLLELRGAVPQPKKEELDIDGEEIPF